MAIGSPQWMYSSATDDYEIQKSLRLDEDRASYLSRTVTTAGNRKTFTWSGWVKRGELGIERALWGVAESPSQANVGFGLYFFTDDCLRCWVNGGQASFRTTAKYRDTSAWYHIVFKSSTVSPYFNLYVNGDEVTDFTWDTRTTYPGTNDTEMNQANTVHYVGGWKNGGYTATAGYLAEVNFIDGQALNPSNFGETGDYGEWKPIEYSGTYGTNGYYLNFAGGGIISSATGGNSTGTTGDYKYKTYTSSGTFTPSNDGYIEYLVVGGGGGGGLGLGGGGGAGGFKTGFVEVTGSTAYTVTVGAGGSYDANGSDSSISGTGFTTITATGGGRGGGSNDPATGGSGGGGRGIGSGSIITGASGTSGQGNAGGNGVGADGFPAGGGGGAGAVGANGVGSGSGGDGGVGLQSNIDTNNYYYAAGGGGGAHFSPSTTGGDGGTGGGGGGARGGGSAGSGGGSARNAGSAGGTGDGGAGGAAGANTGSGGGGGAWGGGNGGAGGSGIVIIRYRFQ